MRRREQDTSEDAEINITPMLDVVFIMLIFFIVTSTFVKESGAEVTKPEAVNAEQQKRVAILVAITDDNKIWMNNEEVDVTEVAITADKLHQENPQGGVVIQADTKSEAGMLLKVMDQLRQVAFPYISISTEKG